MNGCCVKQDLLQEQVRVSWGMVIGRRISGSRDTSSWLSRLFFGLSLSSVNRIAFLLGLSTHRGRWRMSGGIQCVGSVLMSGICNMQ